MKKRWVKLAHSTLIFLQADSEKFFRGEVFGKESCIRGGKASPAGGGHRRRIGLSSGDWHGPLWRTAGVYGAELLVVPVLYVVIKSLEAHFLGGEIPPDDFGDGSSGNSKYYHRQRLERTYMAIGGIGGLIVGASQEWLRQLREKREREEEQSSRPIQSLLDYSLKGIQAGGIEGGR